MLAAANDRGEIIFYDEGEMTSMTKINLRTRSIEDNGTNVTSGANTSKYYKEDALVDCALLPPLELARVNSSKARKLYVKI